MAISNLSCSIKKLQIKYYEIIHLRKIDVMCEFYSSYVKVIGCVSLCTKESC